MSTCTCTVPGFIDVACPVAHDEFLPAKCPCGAVWPPGTWNERRYPACHSCGRVCITCCECAYNLAPDASDQVESAESGVDYDTFERDFDEAMRIAYAAEAAREHVDDPHATRMVPSPYASTMPNRAARRQHDRDVRRNRVGNSRGRR